jgi:RNA polymerase sigma-70 factor (ECF subfamily)
MVEDVRREMVALLPRLRRFAYSLSGSMECADDLVQAACERALSRLDQYETGTRLDSWMFRLVQTIWIDRKRYEARRQNVGDEMVMAAFAFDARIHEQTEARFSLEIVRREIAKLSEDQRAVLALVAIDGMSYQEAADTLGVKIGTVMSRLSRARLRLAAAIDAEFLEDRDAGTKNDRAG